MPYIFEALEWMNNHSQLIAAIIAGGALIWSARTYRESVSLSHYAELDRMYAELLSIAVEKSKLRNVEIELDQSAFTYAYMVWNFIEAVHDRVFDHNSDKKLRDTWRAVIRVEYELFGPWLEANSGMFKKQFVTFMKATKERERLTSARKMINLKPPPLA